ncbi:MAG: hypothetical protein D3904_16895 [Candidatus Electrothrix sp. EH2]|nr:hypothetical protein [Candidatus Electrothrix sp. EH2]
MIFCPFVGFGPVKETRFHWPCRPERTEQGTVPLHFLDNSYKTILRLPRLDIIHYAAALLKNVHGELRKIQE